MLEPRAVRTIVKLVVGEDRVSRMYRSYTDLDRSYQGRFNDYRTITYRTNHFMPFSLADIDSIRKALKSADPKIEVYGTAHNGEGYLHLKIRNVDAPSY